MGKCQDIVLNDRYIWVHDIPQDRCEEWLDFVTEYNKNVKDKTPAIFILEVHGFYGRSPKGIQKLVFDQAITAYDRFAFCALAASDSNTCREYLRPYLAELVSTVCRDDIELCAACIQKGVRFLKDPKNTLKQIISTEYRSDGERYSYLRLDDLRSLIWETQLKAVFPVIEQYRSYFIKKYSSYIQKALPFSNPNGQDISSPEDVEIGMLVYLVGNGNITLADSSEYPELERFRDARNNLAHLNILEPEGVELILKRAETL